MIDEKIAEHDTQHILNGQCPFCGIRFIDVTHPLPCEDAPIGYEVGLHPSLEKWVARMRVGEDRLFLRNGKQPVLRDSGEEMIRYCQEHYRRELAYNQVVPNFA